MATKYLGIPLSAQSLLDLELPTNWLVEPWLLEGGALLIVGPAKLGKSILAQQLALCVANGSPFLGMPTRQGGVVDIDFEMGLWVVKDRLKKQTQVYPPAGLTIISRPSSAEEALDQALKVPDTQLLIFDTLIHLGYEDENDNAAVLKRLSLIDRYRDATGAAVVIVHHAGKPGMKGSGHMGLNLSRGATSIIGWIDTGVVLFGESKSPVAEVYVDTRIAPPQDTLMIERDEKTLIYSVRKTLRAEEVVSEVVEDFWDEYGREPTQAELAKRVGDRLGVSSRRAYDKAPIKKAKKG